MLGTCRILGILVVIKSILQILLQPMLQRHKPFATFLSLQMIRVVATWKYNRLVRCENENRTKCKDHEFTLTKVSGTFYHQRSLPWDLCATWASSTREVHSMYIYNECWSNNDELGIKNTVRFFFFTCCTISWYTFEMEKFDLWRVM